jgi:hypothetical protein
MILLNTIRKFYQNNKVLKTLHDKTAKIFQITMELHINIYDNILHFSNEPIVLFYLFKDKD